MSNLDLFGDSKNKDTTASMSGSRKSTQHRKKGKKSQVIGSENAPDKSVEEVSPNNRFELDSDLTETDSTNMKNEDEFITTKTQDETEAQAELEKDSSEEFTIKTKPKEDIPLYISISLRDKEPYRKYSGQEKEDEQMPILDFDPLAVYKGMVRRYFSINKHTIGLFMGGLIALRKALPEERTKGLHFLFTRMAAYLVNPFVSKKLKNLPFPTQLRMRLELLGPTYIKFGQILALREDILPKAVTKELNNLLDRLPEIPFREIKEIIETSLEKPLDNCFISVNNSPIGSASIAQTHLAETKEGDKVVLKVVKPGIRDSVLTDIRLLKILSSVLQWAIPQYQPKMLIDEFCTYTEKEVDLRNEADHAELFAANFEGMKNVRFPKIYRKYSSEDVLCMEFFDGLKPGGEASQQLPLEERQELVELGAASIIQMLYKDGFFHADLHPGNLMILSGPQLGFIDLGMVGRFEEKTRRRMLYYFHSLVNGDIDGATKYLLSMAKLGDNGDANGFKRAVADLLRRFYQNAQRGDFSLGKLILESMAIGGSYRVFFPVEMTLMTKALVTFEGVGMSLVPKLDVPGLSRKYVSQIFKEQFNPVTLSKELMRSAPEFLDMMVQLPKITADGLKYIEESINERSPSNPLEGLRSSIIAGACIIGGVIALVQGAHWGIFTTFFGLGLLLSLFGK